MRSIATVPRVSAHLQVFDKFLFRDLWVPGLQLQVHGGSVEWAITVLTVDPVSQVIVHPHRHCQDLLIAEYQEPDGGGISGDNYKQEIIIEKCKIVQT